MSADNGVYILKSKDGYRVTHAQAIDNLWYWEEDESKRFKELNPKYLKIYFEDCKVVSTNIEALSEAKKMAIEINRQGLPLEYGIQFIVGWEDKEFPS